MAALADLPTALHQLLNIAAWHLVCSVKLLLVTAAESFATSAAPTGRCKRQHRAATSTCRAAFPALDFGAV
jgi:hypothetical protein